MSNRPKQLGFGNVLAIATALISAGVVYGQTMSRIDNLETQVETYEAEMLPLLRSLEKDVSQIKVQQAKIATDIEWLKQNVNPSK